MSLASIVLIGLGANFPNPGVFIDLEFAQGPAGGSAGPRNILVMGNKTTAGSATADTVVYGPDTQTPCQTEADVISLFGSGSQLHRAFLRLTAVMPSAGASIAIYYIAVTESAGAAASLAETITTTALSNGNHRTWCVDDFVDTPITSGDTATVIAGNIASSVNSMSRWPVTAAAVGGVVTFTAKNHGPEGNWIRMQALITPGTSVIGTTTSQTANSFLTGGVTADSNVAALATIIATRYYYIVVCDSDATNVGRVVSQVNSQALPTIGIRQRVVSGGMDTLANTITIATGLNAARSELVWGPALDLTPLELAANNTAIYAFLETGNAIGVARKNFSLFPSTPNDQVLWKLKPGRSGATGAPTTAQITSALNNGITPMTIISGPGGGAAQLVKRITTRSLNGAVADYRVRDAHKVTVCDYWCDDAKAITQLQFGGKDLLPDPVQGQSPPPANATTPRLWGNALKALVQSYGNAGQWTYPPGLPVLAGQSPADVINANMIVQAELIPPNRLSAMAPLAPVNLADTFALLVNQVG